MIGNGPRLSNDRASLEISQNGLLSLCSAAECTINELAESSLRS
jgi:hypothetical protein